MPRGFGPRGFLTEEEKQNSTKEKEAYAILQKQLKTILDKLPEQEREVISMRFGPDVESESSHEK